jgi:hypothetical protein
MPAQTRYDAVSDLGAGMAAKALVGKIWLINMSVHISTVKLKKKWTALFESAFHRSFDRVRWYRGDAIDRLLTGRGALALTVSPEMVLLHKFFFQISAYPKALIIGHELAHTVQLGKGGNDSARQLEAEAWHAAALALSGRRVRIDGKASRPLTALALLQNADARNYFNYFPHLLDLAISRATLVRPFHFERLMDMMLASDERDFVIESHGNPSGLSMPLRATTRQQGATEFEVTRSSLDKLSRMRQIHRNASQAGDDLSRWSRLIESIEARMPESAVPWSQRIGRPGSGDEQRRVDAARSLVRNWMIREAESLNLNEEQLDRYIEKSNRIYEKGIRKIAFVGCNLGRRLDSLQAMRVFFNAQRFGAPTVRSGYGRVSVGLGARAMRLLLARFQPLIFGRQGQRFAIHITNRGRSIYAAADNQNAVKEWIIDHLMLGGEGRRRTFPLHWLQLAPATFPRDPAYRQHFRYSSELWYSDFPGPQ